MQNFNYISYEYVNIYCLYDWAEKYFFGGAVEGGKANQVFQHIFRIAGKMPKSAEKSLSGSFQMLLGSKQLSMRNKKRQWSLEMLKCAYGNRKQAKKYREGKSR